MVISALDPVVICTSARICDGRSVSWLDHVKDNIVSNVSCILYMYLEETRMSTFVNVAQQTLTLCNLLKHKFECLVSRRSLCNCYVFAVLPEKAIRELTHELVSLYSIIYDVRKITCHQDL